MPSKAGVQGSSISEMTATRQTAQPHPPAHFTSEETGTQRGPGVDSKSHHMPVEELGPGPQKPTFQLLCLPKQGCPEHVWGSWHAHLPATLSLTSSPPPAPRPQRGARQILLPNLAVCPSAASPQNPNLGILISSPVTRAGVGVHVSAINVSFSARLHAP